LVDLEANLQVLVLGSSGMVGSRVADHLAKVGFQVTGVSRQRKPALEQNWKSLEVDSYAELKFDFEAFAIVNCAGPSSQWAAKHPQAFKSFVQKHAANIQEATRQTGARHVINTSTVHVYAKEFRGVISEAHPHNSDHPYATGHSLLEGLLSEQVNVANLRLSNSYGASRGLSSSSWVLLTQDLVRQFVATGNATITGNPLAGRDFIPLSEVVKTTQHVLETGITGPFNVVSSKTLRLVDWAQDLANVGSKILDKELFVDSPNPGFEVPDFSFASEKLNRTGYSHRVDPRSELESLFKLAIEVKREE